MKQEIILINAIDEDHLKNVVETMQTLGNPTIKAVWAEQWSAWVALEGSHRCHAAKQLGLTVMIEEVEYSNTQLFDLGIEDGTNWDSTVEEYFDSAPASANAGYALITNCERI